LNGLTGEVWDEGIDSNQVDPSGLLRHQELHLIDPKLHKLAQADIPGALQLPQALHKVVRLGNDDSIDEGDQASEEGGARRNRLAY